MCADTNTDLKPGNPCSKPTLSVDPSYSHLMLLPRGEAPKKCSTFLGGFSHKIIITSTTPIVTPEFSSDLERAPGARSIADENSGVTFGVVELRRCEAYEHFRSHPVLLGTLPLLTRSPNGRGLAPIGTLQHQICLVRPFLSRKAFFFWVLWAYP